MRFTNCFGDILMVWRAVLRIWPLTSCCGCSYRTELQIAGNFGGIKALIAVSNWYLSWVCIMIKIDIIVLVWMPIHNLPLVRQPFFIYVMVNDKRSPGKGDQEGHCQHWGERGQGRRNVLCSVVVLDGRYQFQPVSYLYWSFQQVNHFQVRVVLTADENVVYVT